MKLTKNDLHNNKSNIKPSSIANIYLQIFLFRYGRTYGIRKFKKGRRVGSKAMGGPSKRQRRITSDMINFERRQVSWTILMPYIC